jgi:excisionase family DNA binding protein
MMPTKRISRWTSRHDLPEKLRVDEAARWLSISRTYCFALLHAGRLGTPVRYGRLIRIRREHLLAYADAGDGIVPPQE